MRALLTNGFSIHERCGARYEWSLTVLRVGQWVDDGRLLFISNFLFGGVCSMGLLDSLLWVKIKIEANQFTDHLFHLKRYDVFQ
jgi:hypothetical protein